MSSKSSCPCPACRGKLVSHFIRHQHMKLFVTGRKAEGELTEPPSADIEGDSPLDLVCACNRNLK